MATTVNSEANIAVLIVIPKNIILFNINSDIDNNEWY